MTFPNGLLYYDIRWERSSSPPSLIFIWVLTFRIKIALVSTLYNFFFVCLWVFNKNYFSKQNCFIIFFFGKLHMYLIELEPIILSIITLLLQEKPRFLPWISRGRWPLLTTRWLSSPPILRVFEYFFSCCLFSSL